MTIVDFNNTIHSELASIPGSAGLHAVVSLTINHTKQYKSSFKVQSIEFQNVSQLSSGWCQRTCLCLCMSEGFFKEGGGGHNNRLPSHDCFLFTTCILFRAGRQRQLKSPVYSYLIHSLHVFGLILEKYTHIHTQTTHRHHLPQPGHEPVTFLL